MAYPARPNARPVGELIGGALDPIVKKRGLARAELLAWWPDIVGAAYADATAPERIRWPRAGQGGATLVVRCDPALALQLAHETERVRERLNGFFGYPAVARVSIVQQRIAARERPAAPREPAAIPAALDGRLDRCDAPLRESLRELARQVLARS